MNALAKQLGMERTRFVNPSGIDDKERPMPYSTAEIWRGSLVTP